jgi:FkbM family methyltransferase
MHQKSLTVMGLIARSIRSMGLGAFLQLGRDVADFMLVKSGRPPLKICLDGHVICGCFRHRSFLYHLSGGNYEAFTVELFKSHLRPGMTVVDGGAHIGFYTLLAAQLVGSSGKVYSFEPDPYNYQCLVFNSLKNDYRNIDSIQRALSNKCETTAFYQSSGTISSSIVDRDLPSSLFKGHSIKKILIQSTTLDVELETSPVDLIKLDIEGAEPFALQGMLNIINRNQPLVLFLEINPSALYSSRTSPEVLIRTLKEFNFDIAFIDESCNRLIPLTEKSPISKGNLYCKRGYNP